MRKFKRIASVVLSASMIFTSCIPYNFMGMTSYAADAEKSVVNLADSSNELSKANDYGLADNIQDGVILHCFNWKYKDIEAELEHIAEAGFTSVQTSPAQKDSSFGVWYMMYQPESFSIQTNALGTKEELKSLCTKAEEYGINVIVDVVANHMRNIGDDGLGSDCFHNDGDAKYDSRFGITHGRIGMPDLKSESTTVQDRVKKYIEELKSVGVDGIRWDAAKHISLPSEQWNNQFWPVVTSVEGMYNYGEILKGPTEAGAGDSTCNAIMKDYTNYMSVTDNIYPKVVRDDMASGKISNSIGNWSANGVAKNKLVYWGESHDTYSNNGEYGEATQNMNQNVIDRTYAIMAAQNAATSLYFSRPYETDKHKINAGVKGSTHFTSKEVAEVNKFHNQMNGQKEYYKVSGGCGVVCREEGAVVVKASGSGQVTCENGGSTTKPGTYIDQVSGNEWTVTATTISGTIGETGIAVLYNPGPVTKKPAATISQQGGSFTTDTLELTIGLNSSATRGTYKIGSGETKTFTSSTKITIGSGMAYGESVDVTLTASDGTDTSEPKTYTFTKKELTGNVAYLKLPSGWSEPVKCYAYDASAKDVNNGWPGVAMTKDTATGLFKYEIPEEYKEPRVIFYSSAENRYPADQQPGLAFETQGSWKYEDGKWAEYITTPPVKEVNVKASLADGSQFKTETETVTLTLENATSGTYSVDKGPVKTFTGTANVIIGQGKIANTDVTVDVTATDGTDKVEKTFTYKKVFSGKVADEKLTDAASLSTASELSTGSNSELPSSIYSTNPNNAVGKEATITIDGDASDWSSDMLIATGGAWDVANHWKGGHENCVLDTTALYAAYDDENLYVAWQMVNTTDTWAKSGDGPLSDGGRVLDVPLILALSIDESSVSMSNKNTTGGSIWGKKMGLTFDKNTSHVDRLLYMSGKPGLGEPSMFKAADDEGNTDYKENCIGFAKGGIEYQMATTNISSAIMGLNSSDSPEDVFDASADWVDYKTFTGSKGKHDTTFDSFYEIKIPYATLGSGIDKNYIVNNGIGAMVVATRGESALDCIPFDASMIDNATGDYSAADDNTSAEKDDIDNVTAPLARIGKMLDGGDNPPIPPVPKELVVNFGADRSSPQLNTTTLTLKAEASGGKSGYKYEFFVDGKSVQASSTTATCSWKGTNGTHLIKVTVTDADGKTVSSQKAYKIEGDGQEVTTDPDETTSKQDETTSKQDETSSGDQKETTSKQNETSSGDQKETTSKQNETSSGDQNETTSKQNETSSGDQKETTSKQDETSSGDQKETTKKQDESSSGDQKETTKKQDESSSGDEKETTKKQEETTKPKEEETTTTSSSKKLQIKKVSVNKKDGKVVTGQSIKISVSATAGQGKLQYKYMVKDKKGKKQVIKSFSTSKTATWKPAKAGDYVITVYVKDGSGKTVTKSIKNYTVKSKMKVTYTGVKSKKVTLGKSVKLKVKVAGGIGTKYLKFTYKYAGKTKQIGNYSSKTSVTWKPKKAGTYNVYVTVTDDLGTKVTKNLGKYTVKKSK